MTKRKTGIKENPLFSKVEDLSLEKEKVDEPKTTGSHVDKKTSKHVSAKGSHLRRKTFYMEEELFQALRRFAFERDEKIYKVVNEAIKNHINSSE